MSLDSLAGQIAAQTGRRYVRLVGRGTTALYVALRTIALTHGPGSVIVPDIVCSAVLDAVLLAGFRPAFADVSPDRLAPTPDTWRAAQRPDSRAVIATHLYGLTSPPPALGLPIIEDAVQGIGGAVGNDPVGRLGALSIVGFHPTKTIPGVGGAILTDDAALARVMQAVRLEDGLPPYAMGRYAGYRPQLESRRAALIRPFDADPDNVATIRAGWAALESVVMSRNRAAAAVRTALAGDAGLGLNLPPLHAGDSVWRYPFTAQTPAAAMLIQRRIQGAGLPGARAYPALSAIFEPQPGFASPEIAARLVALWVDVPESVRGQIVGRVVGRNLTP